MAQRRFALFLIAALSPLGASAGADASRVWDFVVRLDGREIGSHRFAVDETPDGLRVSSQANFSIKLLGVTVYRYRHSSREQWRNGCLSRIDASTDDNGSHVEVHGQQTPEGFAIEGSDSPLTGCVMTFAYWNPRLPSQTHLLDPGTGRFVPVTITALPGSRGWRVTGSKHPIDVLWANGQWTGLDSLVDNRHLTYRLP
jgi:hypothetical protein